MPIEVRISAVIPAYNAGRFLAQAVASIEHQHHGIDEIIIIDDGSSDDTAEVARALDPRVQYIYQDNAGPSAARNRGIEVARGEFIAFLDADDQWTLEKTTQQLECFARHPELALVAADMAETDIDGRIVLPSVLTRHHLHDFFESLDGAPIPNALQRLTEINFIPTGTVLARREALLEAGLFDTGIHYGEDLELWAKVAMKHSIACLPTVGMLRRQHDTNATGHTLPLLTDLVKVMTRLRDSGDALMRQQGVDPDALIARAWADLGYWHFDRGELVQARPAFDASLHAKRSIRALTYAVLSRLPRPLVKGLRGLKQQLGRTH